MGTKEVQTKGGSDPQHVSLDLRAMAYLFLFLMLRHILSLSHASRSTHCSLPLYVATKLVATKASLSPPSLLPDLVKGS